MKCAGASVWGRQGSSNLFVLLVCKQWCANAVFKKDQAPVEMINVGTMMGKGKLQVPDTETRMSGNTGTFLCSTILSYRITLPYRPHKYPKIGRYWHKIDVAVLSNDGIFRYQGLKV